MHLLFVHDHRFVRGAEGRLYTAGSFPAAVWDRYLRHFDSLTVIARDGGAIASGVQLALSNHPLVDFAFAPNLGTLRQLLRPSKAARGQMQAAIEEADAVVARLPSELGLLAVKTARKLGKPYAVEVVGCAWDGFVHHGSPLARLYAPLFFYRMRRAVAKAPFALYVTSSWLQRRYPSQAISSFASNVEIAPLEESVLAERGKRLKQIQEGRLPKLGTVAALTVKTKGIQTAIGAVAKLRSEGLALSYSVLGPGNPEPWQALARTAGVQDLVTFDGTREAGEGVRQWLDQIDIHLQPSLQEGLPRATIEAMSRGVACIGSTCGGIPELLPADRTHRPGSVSGLADCIRKLVRDPLKIVDASEADRELSRTFHTEVLRARRDQVYASLRRAAENALSRGGRGE